MSSETTIAALLDVWPRLQRSPSLYWRLLDLLSDFARAKDEDARAIIANKILASARLLPQDVRDALRNALRGSQGATGSVRSERGEEANVAEPTGNVQGRLDQLLHPELVTRYTDIQFPAQVEVDKRFPLIVGLTRGAAPDSVSTQVVQVHSHQLIRVILTAPDLELLNGATQTLKVEPDRDSSPIVFYLRAKQPGTSSIQVDFWSEQNLLYSQKLSLESVARRVPEHLVKPPTQTLQLGDNHAPYPDLILRVSTLNNQLTYHLHFSDTRMLTIKDGPLGDDPRTSDPRTYRYNLMREIEGLRKRKDVDGNLLPPDEARKAIVRIGQRLYRDLFPEELRREYRQFRAQVQTLEIISDEPWIPWELIKPYDYDEPAFDDDFLCAQFDLARWVMPGFVPATQVAVQSLVCIAPTDSKLVAAQRERAYIQAIAKRLGGTDLTPDAADKPRVIGLLEGKAPVSLWHFACHGNYSDESPDNSPLILLGGKALHPNDLVGPVERRLRTDRPFVFLNACRAGGLGLSLTGLGGWAKVLVGDCRVGALIAPLWSVTDEPAEQFAEAFYGASQEVGSTFAQAARRARKAVREAAPHDPTWLAYSLYAHPNARLVWKAA
jgi:hypothetical protein